MKKLLINAFLGAACLLSCVDASGMDKALQAIKDNNVNELQSAISLNNISFKQGQNFTDFVIKAISAGASNVLKYLMMNAPLNYFAPEGRQFFDLINLALRSGNVEIVQLICSNNAEVIVPRMADQFGWEEFIVSVLYSNNEDLVRFICEFLPDDFKSDFKGFYSKILLAVPGMSLNIMKLLCEDKLFDKISLHKPKYIVHIISMQLSDLEHRQEMEDRDGPNLSEDDKDKKKEAEEKMLLLLSYLRHNDTGIAQYDDLRAILGIDGCYFIPEKELDFTRVFDFNSIDGGIEMNIPTIVLNILEGEPLLSFLDWMTDAYFQQNFTPIFECACQHNWTRAIMRLMQLRKEGVKGVDGVQFDAGPGLSCLVDLIDEQKKWKEEEEEEEEEENDKQSEKISSVIADVISMPNVDLNGKYKGKTVIERAVSGGNIELVKLILKNPRVKVIRALRLCEPDSNMWQLLSKYKDQHLECQWIYVKQDILDAITNYHPTKLMAFLKEAVEVTEPTQIPSKEEAQEAMNKRKTKLKESSKQQILGILFPKK